MFTEPILMQEDAQIFLSDADAYDYKINSNLATDGVISVILTRNEFDLNRYPT